MKKIISDPRFEEWLDDGGGLNDIHPDIAHVLYAAFASGLKTGWSWAGTVGKDTDDYSTNHPELVTYSRGNIKFLTGGENASSASIVESILETAAKNSFVKVDKNCDDGVWLFLTMDDLVVETDQQRIWGLGTHSVPLIREADGIKRYGEFMEVWNGIYQFLKPRIEGNLERANLDLLARDVAANSQHPYPRRIFCDRTKRQFQ